MSKKPKVKEDNQQPESFVEVKKMLSPALAAHYSKHAVQGVEDYLSGGGGGGGGDDDGVTRKTSEKYLAIIPPRFIRLNPRWNMDETLERLRSELPQNSPPPTPIPWLDSRLGFYSLPGDFALSQSASYRDGRIYGMDVSSGAAVATLLFDCYDEKLERRQLPSEEKKCLPPPPPHQPSLQVLDLCCAPGLKTCTIADILSTIRPGSRITGVDASAPRLALCKNLLKKYLIDRHTSGCNNNNDTSCDSAAQPPSPSASSTGAVHIQLFHGDGTTFGTNMATLTDDSLVFDSHIAQQDAARSGTRKKANKSARAREKKNLRNAMRQYRASFDGEDILETFDRVLVDAECSTDGAIRHLQQSLKDGQKKRKYLSDAAAAAAARDDTRLENDDQTRTVINEKLLDETELSKLIELQRRLIASGFRLLKKGGVMVYSTCSLSESQNEDIVSWLLTTNDSCAFIVPVSFPDAMNDHFVRAGSLPGTVRFLPNTGVVDLENANLFGSGLFIAKIGKRS